MITDVLYSVNMYISFLCKAPKAKPCYEHGAIKVLCIFSSSSFLCVRPPTSCFG